MTIGQGSRRSQAAINPAALTAAQAAKLLSAVGTVRVTVEIIRRHLAAGAPLRADGRINLLHYAAWLAKRLKELERYTRGGM